MQKYRDKKSLTQFLIYGISSQEYRAKPTPILLRVTAQYVKPHFFFTKLHPESFYS